MKKSKLTLLFVLSLTGFVPAMTLGQTSPDAKAEASAKSSANKTAESAPISLADDAPTQYTVVKGDTLWDISGRFLKEPWRWPEIWNMNREQIKDPHWIYPGDVIKLSFDASGKPMLSLVGSGDGAGFPGAPGGTVKLSPQLRVDRLAQAIPSIPSKVIGPFLTLPLVIEAGALDNAPKIVAAEDGRVIIGAGNTAYAIGVNPSLGVKWQVYRPGKALTDPYTNETLGYEAIYLGDAKVNKFGESASIEILRSTQEINRGDRLTPTVESTLPSYSPHSPNRVVKGAIVSVVGGVSDAAQYSVVTMNLGKKDGMEIGHVLATLQRGEIVSTKDGVNTGDSGFKLRNWIPFLGTTNSETGERSSASQVKLPDERNGLVFVFRVFDRVSYGLVMSSKRSLKVGDVVQTP